MELEAQHFYNHGKCLKTYQSSLKDTFIYLKYLFMNFPDFLCIFADICAWILVSGLRLLLVSSLSHCRTAAPVPPVSTSALPVGDHTYIDALCAPIIFRSIHPSMSMVRLLLSIYLRVPVTLSPGKDEIVSITSASVLQGPAYRFSMQSYDLRSRKLYTKLASSETLVIMHPPMHLPVRLPTNLPMRQFLTAPSARRQYHSFVDHTS